MYHIAKCNISIYKSSKRRHRANLYEPELGQEYFDMMPKAHSIKEKHITSPKWKMFALQKTQTIDLSSEYIKNSQKSTLQMCQYMV
jgi:hypothetical protein